MNSTKYLDYELRPAKFTERKMLLDSLINVCHFYREDYQYIGFGGISFTDFKLFHRGLNITDMTSIEGGPKISRNRVKYNRPFHFIKLKFGLSTDVLDDLDLSKKSIIWLDYDNDLENSMFEDINHVFRVIPNGSVYMITCNTTLKNDDGEIYSLNELQEKYEDYVPFSIHQKDLTHENSPKVIRKMLINHIQNVLKDRNSRDLTNLKFHQFYNFFYSENGGAPMSTIGGIVEDQDFDIYKELRLNNFEFIKSGEDIYHIELPNITYKEKDLVNTNGNEIKKLEKQGILSPTEIKQYLKIYKYLPRFFDVRM